MAIPLSSVDQLYYTVTQITTHHYDDEDQVNSKPLDKGTGFFYRNLSTKNLFLITNRHVILSKHFAHLARIRLHSNKGDLRINEYYDLPLYDEKGKKKWVEPNPKSADVVAIPLDNDFHRKGFHFRNFNAVNLLPNNITLHLGEDVIVMGYPLGIFDDIHNLPILRNGMIASAYPIPFKKNPYFLVDSYLEEGTSGSPVITKFKESWRTIDGSKPPIGFSFFLLGINSATFPVEEAEKPVELNAVYFASIIENMTASNQNP